jgi:hypothetical protein
MRLLFGSSESQAECRQREIIMVRTDAFWQRVVRGHTAHELSNAVSNIDSRLLYEPLEQPGLSASVITSNELRLRPLVQTVLSRAPAGCDRQILGERPALSVERGLAKVAERSPIDVASARFRAGFSRGHLLELVIHLPNLASNDDEDALSAAELLAEALLGQHVFDNWIGRLAVAPLPKKGSLSVVNSKASASTLPIAELAATVANAIERLYDGLPKAPSYEGCERRTWTMLEATPEPAADYGAQDDLVVSTSFHPELIKCFLEGAPFSSCRFSRCGERFGFLKFENSASGLSSAARIRSALEDRIHDALVLAKAGCVIGSGLGLRYSYIDVALSRLADGIEIMRRAAQSAQVPYRSWIQFCDSEWADEWIAIWDDEVRPPGMA